MALTGFRTRDYKRRMRKVMKEALKSVFVEVSRSGGYEERGKTGRVFIYRQARGSVPTSRSSPILSACVEMHIHDTMKL